MALTRERFADFFAAVRRKQRPFAWQERLLDALLSDERWPDRIVAPTGAGKTAVIDVHVYANALAAAGGAPRIPRRLVLVVDRRAVVDSHDEHARHVASLLAAAEEGVLSEVAGALGRFRLDLDAISLPTGRYDRDSAPLVTARLRGGAPPPRSWRDAPEVCAVLTGTPDMVGSRLLLQGYGSSVRAWPREAGLLAFDTALVVDEAHLSRQFLRTARRIARLAHMPGGAPVTGGVPVLQVVETTATPEAGTGLEVGVQGQDLSDPVLKRRMCTPKSVELLPLPNWPLAPRGNGLERMAEEVQRARRDFGPTVGCVVNRVASATALAARLRAAGMVVELLVGRMRPADVDHLRRRRPGLLELTGNVDVDVLVSTQTVEVGLDLDLSALVTELAPGAALAQRSGRVNRIGDRAATRVVVAVPDSDAVPDRGSEPYTADDLNQSLKWIRRRCDQPEGLAPWSVRADPAPGQSLRRGLLRRLELADSWLWARTGDVPFERPDLDLWLDDDLSAERDVGLVCRADLPQDPSSATSLLRLLPPRPHEVFPVPIHVLRALLPDLIARSPIVLRHRPEDIAPLMADTDAVVRVGDIVVVDASVAVQEAGVVLADSNREPAIDVLEHPHSGGQPGAPVRRGNVVLRWGGEVARATEEGEPTRHLARRQGFPLGTLPEAAQDVLRQGPAGTSGHWSREQRRLLADVLAGTSPVSDLTPEQADDIRAMRDAAVDLLRHGRVKDAGVHVLGTNMDGESTLVVVLDQRRAAADEDIRQTWTPSDHAVPLDQHGRAVAAAAAWLGEALGLNPPQVEALRLAGRHHDDGKADPRFQTVLGRGDDDPPLAKSAKATAGGDLSTRSAAGLPLGWRHEQRSVLAAWDVVPPPTRRLVARLVGTSHGHGRSGFPHGAAALLGQSAADLPADARALFDDGEWEQLVDDTDEQYGVWALAYLEAVLRAADGRVSAAGS